MRAWAWVAAIGSLVLSFFAVRLVAIEVPHFSDPCFQWGAGNRTSREASAQIGPDDPCKSISVTSETRTQALVRILLVSGGILVTTGIGLFAILRRKPVLMAVTGMVWIAGAVPLVTLMPVALLTGSALLVASAHTRLSQQ